MATHEGEVAAIETRKDAEAAQTAALLRELCLGDAPAGVR